MFDRGGAQLARSFDVDDDRFVARGKHTEAGDLARVLFDDLVADPGETRDLADAMPEAFAAMQADYAAYAQANGVLPMPAGYDAIRQVLINSLLNVYWPATKRALPAALAVVLLVLGAWWFVRRRRRALPAG